MPHDINFGIPAQTRYNPSHSDAEQHNLEWLLHYQLLGDSVAVRTYSSWRIADLAARCWPDVNADDLALAVDLKSFYFLFDDQFDGPQGYDPVEVAAACLDLIDIVHRDNTDPLHFPATAAFADLWARSCDGMSAAWIARASHDWERYFASYPHEALKRRPRTVPVMDDYLITRRGSAATESVIDMVERLNQIEVPSIALHSPQLRLMRQIAADVPFICNDVYSYEKETIRGDVYNLITVLCHERKYSVKRAVAEIQTIVTNQVQRFLQLRNQVPQLADDLELSDLQRWQVGKYVVGLGDWLRGHNDWMARTARYRAAEPPANRPSGQREEPPDLTDLPTEPTVEIHRENHNSQAEVTP